MKQNRQKQIIHLFEKLEPTNVWFSLMNLNNLTFNLNL